MAILTLLAAVAAAFPAPITPAADGKAHCYSPDQARKVCASLAVYSLTADGGVIGETTVAIARNPTITMTTASAMTVTNGRLCSVLLKENVAGAKFVIDGADPDDARATQLRNAVANEFSPIIGHTVCVSYEPDGSGFTAHTAFDGLPRPSLDQRVIWVSPGDGWKVEP
jgi:hypothetical protein